MRTILLLLGLIGCQALWAAGDNDSLLNVLDRTIEDHHLFEQAKSNRILPLKELLQKDHSPENQYQCYSRLMTEYETFSYDSAIFYINKNLALLNSQNDSDDKLNELYLSFASLMASTGRYHESFDLLSQIKHSILQKKQREIYYAIEMKLNAELAFYNLNNEFAAKYDARKEAYRDSLLAIVPQESERARAIQEARFREAGAWDSALRINTLRLRDSEPGTRSYALVAFERTLLHERMGNKQMQIKYLTLSAISDIQSATKDNISLTRLARLFYEQGDIARAYLYIRTAFEDAAFYKSRLRYVQINNILPLITKAYQQKSQEQYGLLYKMLLVISLLAVILLLAIVLIIVQYKKLALARIALEGMNQKLTEINSSLTQANQNLVGSNSQLLDSNLIKEQYIGEFLETCFNYIEKLDSYRKMVNKHLINKQITELMTKTSSATMLEEELAGFYQNFDQTFLKLYPDFVTQFNRLLVAEEQIIPKKTGMLNVELRIFALIRLGITDSATIARLLRYSINTIYNYRVKIKKSALVERVEFETLVMQIGTTKQVTLK